MQVGEDIDGEAADDSSGSSVSMSSDGNTVAIGAYGNDGKGTDSGHVRIYQLGTLDYETKASYAVTLVTGSLTNSVTTNHTLTISDVDEAPTAIALKNAVTSLPDDANMTNRTKMGDIVTTDDALGTNVVTLSGADATAFEVDGSELFLKANVTLDYRSKASYVVTLSTGSVTINHTLTISKVEALVSTLAGGGEVGTDDDDGEGGSADGTGTDASFSYPYGVAVDGSGNVYVGD